jgi:hypothetical protein
MNNSNHLKRKKTLIQFSDGSSSYILSYINKKEFILELDTKSNPLWNNVSVESSKVIEERSAYFNRKFFNKNK